METTFKPDNSPTENELVLKALATRAGQRHLTGTVLSYQQKVARTYYHFEQQTKRNPDEFIKYAKTQDNIDIDDLIRAETRKMSTNKPQQDQDYYQMRGLLTTNGISMPKVKNTYTPQDHPEYKKEDLRELLKYLQNKVHKLYVYIASESGLRAQTILK